LAEKGRKSLAEAGKSTPSGRTNSERRRDNIWDEVCTVRMDHSPDERLPEHGLYMHEILGVLHMACSDTELFCKRPMHNHATMGRLPTGSSSGSRCIFISAWPNRSALRCSECQEGLEDEQMATKMLANFAGQRHLEEPHVPAAVRFATESKGQGSSLKAITKKVMSTRASMAMAETDILQSSAADAASRDDGDTKAAALPKMDKALARKLRAKLRTATSLPAKVGEISKGKEEKKAEWDSESAKNLLTPLFARFQRSNGMINTQDFLDLLRKGLRLMASDISDQDATTLATCLLESERTGKFGVLHLMTFLKQELSMASLENYDQAPKVLCVSDCGNKRYNGEYRLCDLEPESTPILSRRNDSGACIWQRHAAEKDESGFIFIGRKGKWMIGDEEEAAQKFDCDTCKFSTSGKNRTLWPNDVNCGGWMRFDEAQGILLDCMLMHISVVDVKAQKRRERHGLQRISTIMEDPTDALVARSSVLAINTNPKSKAGGKSTSLRNSTKRKTDINIEELSSLQDMKDSKAAGLLGASSPRKTSSVPMRPGKQEVASSSPSSPNFSKKGGNEKVEATARKSPDGGGAGGGGAAGGERADSKKAGAVAALNKAKKAEKGAEKLPKKGAGAKKEKSSNPGSPNKRQIDDSDSDGEAFWGKD